MADSGPKAPNVPLFRRPGCWIGFLTVIPLLIGGVFLVENWAGARALRRVKVEAAASGIELDPLKRPSARPPDEENFCATPLLLAIGNGTAAGPEIEAIRRIGGWHSYVSQARITFQSVDHHDPTDWAAVHKAVEARTQAADLNPGAGDPVAELSEHIERILAPTFDELSAALPRPHSCFVPELTEILAEGGPLGHTDSLIGDTLLLRFVLGLRARLDMEAGRMERAAESILILLRLAEGMEEYGDAVVGTAAREIRSLAHSIMWVAAWRSALPREEWIACALALRRQRPLDHFMKTAELGMIYHHVRVMKLVRSDPRWLWGRWIVKGTAPPDRSWQHIALGFIPRGWFDFNEAKALDAGLHLIRRVQDEGIADRYDNAANSDLFHRRSGPRSFPWHNLTAEAVAASVLVASQSYSHSHAMTRLAEVAFALETWHIDHRAYPASLDSLVPDYLPALPADLDGKPVRYAPDPANQRYKLWSIGHDGIDGGGVEKSEGDWRPPRPWKEPVGDWVWQYPE